MVRVTSWGVRVPPENKRNRFGVFSTGCPRLDDTIGDGSVISTNSLGVYNITSKSMEVVSQEVVNTCLFCEYPQCIYDGRIC